MTEPRNVGGKNPHGTKPEISRQMDTCYRDAIDNIRFAKQQQWIVTNYTLAAYAALFYLHDKHFIVSCFGIMIFVGLTTAGLAFNWIALLLLQNDIRKFRGRLTTIYHEHFTRGMLNDLGIGGNAKGFWHQAWILYGLLLVSAFAAMILIYKFLEVGVTNSPVAACLENLRPAELSSIGG